MGTRRVRRAAIAALATSIMLAIGGAQATAATLTVTTTQDETNASDGVCSLREAIEQGNSPGGPGDPSCGRAANAPNTIVLGAHDYHLTIPPTVFDFDHGDLKFSSLNTLTIQGAGTGNTTIDATGLGDRAMYVVPGALAGLKDLTVSGGHAADGAKGTTGSAGVAPSTPGGTGGTGTAGESGGGIENFGTLGLDDVAVIGNRAGNGGAGGDGGQGGDAVGSKGGNGGQGGNGGSGGGIYTEGALTVVDSTISGNRAGNGGNGGLGGLAGTPAGYYAGKGGLGGCCGDGGGIAGQGSSAVVTVIGSAITGNFAGNGGDGGSGGTYPDMIGTYKGGDGNNGFGGSWGGGVSDASGTLSVTNSTITGNRAGDGGQPGQGGLSWGGTLSPGNSGSYGPGGNGGGLRISSPGAALLTNVSIARNATGINTNPYLLTPGLGGGIWAQSPVTLENTLLASDGNGGNCATNTGSVSTQFVDGGHNLSFGDLSCPPSFASGDPKLGTLKGNGGVTQTIALGTGSAARDQVPATGAHCPGTDQRGVARPSGSFCDIGAYELAPPKVSGGPVTKVTPTGATVTDSLLGNQAQASAYFQFGPSLAYGLQTSVQHVVGLAPTNLSASFTALRPDTTYHYRMLATSVDGTALGSDQTFTTAPITPVIINLRVNPSTRKVTYSDSEAAVTTLVIRRCKNKRCTRQKHTATISHRDRAGANTIRFPHLAAGRYRLKAVPRIGPLTGRPRAVRFRIF